MIAHASAAADSRPAIASACAAWSAVRRRVMVAVLMVCIPSCGACVACVTGGYGSCTRPAVPSTATRGLGNPTHWVAVLAASLPGRARNPVPAGILTVPHATRATLRTLRDDTVAE